MYLFVDGAGWTSCLFCFYQRAGEAAGADRRIFNRFFIAALICGYLIDRSKGSVLMYSVGMVLGAVVYYLFGTVWLAFQLSMQGAAGQEGSIRAILAGMDFKAALAAGVYPFIIGDILKMVVAF